MSGVDPAGAVEPADLPYYAAATIADDLDLCDAWALLAAGGEFRIDELRMLLDGLERPWSMARALLDMGVDQRLLAQLGAVGDIGLAQVDLLKGGRFTFGGPDRRLVLAVRVYGELVDLVALSSTCEDEWALYRGAADFLGEEVLDRAVICEEREVRLWATPFAWLRAGGTGVCCLDWTRMALSALRGLRETTTLVCDPGAGRRLEALLAHGGLPMVAEDRPMRRVA